MRDDVPHQYARGLAIQAFRCAKRAGAVMVFAGHLRNRPELALVIRTITIVWGIGLSGESLVRYLIAWHWGNSPHVSNLSSHFGYGVYGVLTLWTIRRRKRIKQGMSIYDVEAGSVAR